MFELLMVASCLEKAKINSLVCPSAGQTADKANKGGTGGDQDVGGLRLTFSFVLSFSRASRRTSGSRRFSTTSRALEVSPHLHINFEILGSWCRRREKNGRGSRFCDASFLMETLCPLLGSKQGFYSIPATWVANS